VGSTGLALANDKVTTDGTSYVESSSNDIVMTYTQEGSTFFDAVSDTWTAGAGNSVHDELAADTTVGTTFDVASSEDIHLFFFDETGNTADSDAKICAGTIPQLAFEYNGKFGTPFNLCASGSAFVADSVLQTAIVAMSGLKTATATLVAKGSGGTTAATTSDALFNSFFAWGATHKGYAVGNLQVTLPLGVDGSKFNIHVLTKNTNGLGLGDSTITMAGQTYLHRARNNNGRSFTVTQAYENKVAGATQFSRVPSATVFAAGVVKTAVGAGLFGILTPAALMSATYNPGTYYNVKITPALVANDLGIGIYAKVVVGTDGVKSVEVTSGGRAAAAGGAYHIRCDTRINSAFSSCQESPTTGSFLAITLGAGSKVLNTNNLLQTSLRVGAVSKAAADTTTVAAMCGTGVGSWRRDKIYDSAVHKVNHVSGITYCDQGDGAATDFIASSGGMALGGAPAADTDTLAADVTDLLTSSPATAWKVDKKSINFFYYQAGFYDTTVPQFYRDALHEGTNEVSDVHASQMVTVMGGRTGSSAYLYDAKVGTDNRQMFGGLKDFGFTGHGYARRLKAGRMTSSVIMGNQDESATMTLADTFSEHMEKYAYVGRGFDQLTVTPTPDAMTGKKVVITYHGAAGGCSVTEVDRGTHESSVCSGRGNCDFSSGTCLCDAGYTLEACSEQTVLV